MKKKKEMDSEIVTQDKNKSQKIEDKVIENLVELQKVQTILAEKFDKLADQIANLLTLFETAARSFAQNPVVQASEKDKEFLDKINKLLDQNKTIAKGLTLMEERIRERVYGQQTTPNPVEEKEIPEEGTEETEESFEKSELPPEDSFKSPPIGKPLPKF